MGKRRPSSPQAQFTVSQHPQQSSNANGQAAFEPAATVAGQSAGLLSASPRPSVSASLTPSVSASLPLSVSPSPLLPHYDADLRELSVEGSVILRLPVQGHNLAAILSSLQDSGWKPRVAKPLIGRRDGSEPSHLADAVYSLNQRQSHIDFHADGGAVRWNWRQQVKATHHPSHNGKPKRAAGPNARRGRQEDREKVD